MLIKSDLLPLPCPGRFRFNDGFGREVDAREAMEAMDRGHDVVAADEATLELLADRIKGRDEERARMFLRLSRGAQVVPELDAPEADTGDAEAHGAETEGGGEKPQGVPEVGAEGLEQSTALLQQLVEEAGDNPDQLRTLAERVGAELGRKTAPSSIRDAIFAAASKAVAEGRLPLSE